ncbi:MAG TPA: hypothetical protein VN372_09350 [Methanospirillum sp.]|nr:hypothetical protein [Methanospirillum sp.]
MNKKQIFRHHEIRIHLREIEDSVEIIRQHLPATNNVDEFINLGL